jgi:hypothetical protein
MNTDNIWIALATFGRVKIPLDQLRNISTLGSAEMGERLVRNQMNSEAVDEGVSLRINSIMKDDYFQGIDISLRKFAA